MKKGGIEQVIPSLKKKKNGLLSVGIKGEIKESANHHSRPGKKKERGLVGFGLPERGGI